MATRMAPSTQEALLLNFYDPDSRGSFDPERPDDNTCRLEGFLHWDNARIESEHGFIQALFPVPEPSRYHYRAPVLTEFVRDAFEADFRLRLNLYRVFAKMLACFGLRPSYRDEEGFVVTGSSFVTFERAADFIPRAPKTWLRPYSHNHLRITRIIRCMRILCFDETAVVFSIALTRWNQASGHKVNGATLARWYDAAEHPLWQSQSDGHGPVEWLRDTGDGPWKEGDRPKLKWKAAEVAAFIDRERMDRGAFGAHGPFKIQPVLTEDELTRIPNLAADVDSDGDSVLAPEG